MNTTNHRPVSIRWFGYHYNEACRLESRGAFDRALVSISKAERRTDDPKVLESLKEWKLRIEQKIKVANA